MPAPDSCNYWVFREGRSTVCGESLRDRLAKSLAALARPTRDAVVTALIEAGELETALTDSGATGHSVAALLTDEIAGALVHLRTAHVDPPTTLRLLESISIPENLNLSTSEGFAYYALHPLDFAELLARIQVQPDRAAVVGIRSIGATLSAVVKAVLRRKGLHADRITVRPMGDPYNRTTAFTPDQLRWIAAERSRRAHFFVVDEGPGMSGSSFLSVGDALLQAGVERRQITFLCSRNPDPDGLAAAGAGERWRAFQSFAVSPTKQIPADADSFVGAGEWRPWRYPDESQWPASWVFLERAKYLSRDRRSLYKFCGLGRFGEAVAERACLLARSGFAPQFLGAANGWAEYTAVESRPARPADASTALLDRLADYCAFRAVEFRTAAVEWKLEEMARVNFASVYGREAPDWLRLEVPRSTVLADSRMLPHEWLLCDGGAMKTDGETHGDDHFFPGPADIAWDLAGAIVEWKLDSSAADYLVRRYASRSGDNVSARLRPYTVAYALFRMGHCAMAAYALRGVREEQRLRQAANVYYDVITRLIHPARRSAPAFPLSHRQLVSNAND